MSTSTVHHSGPSQPLVSKLQRDPDRWKTGQDPMTAAQASYLHTLAEEAGKTLPEDLTKSEAAKEIDALRAEVGLPANGPDASADAGLRRDPDAWKTGQEPMTAAQSSYLHTLAEEAGQSKNVSDDLTKAEASKQIEVLQEQTGRGQPPSDPAPQPRRPAKRRTARA